MILYVRSDMKLLRHGALTICDATLSDVYVVFVMLRLVSVSPALLGGKIQFTCTTKKEYRAQFVSTAVIYSNFVF